MINIQTWSSRSMLRLSTDLWLRIDEGKNDRERSRDTRLLPLPLPRPKNTLFRLFDLLIFSELAVTAATPVRALFTSWPSDEESDEMSAVVLAALLLFRLARWLLEFDADLNFKLFMLLLLRLLLLLMLLSALLLDGGGRWGGWLMGSWGERGGVCLPDSRLLNAFPEKKKKIFHVNQVDFHLRNAWITLLENFVKLCLVFCSLLAKKPMWGGELGFDAMYFFFSWIHSSFESFYNYYKAN